MNIKERLAQALTNAGVEAGALTAIQSLPDAAVESLQGELFAAVQPQDFVKSAQFQQFLEKSGLDGLAAENKAVQSLMDKKIAKALETQKKKFEALLGGQEQTPEGGGDGETTGTSPEMAAVLKQIEAQNKRIEELIAAQGQQTKAEQAKAAITKSQLPVELQEKWSKRIDLNGDIDKQVAELEAEYLEFFGAQAGSLFKPTKNASRSADTARASEIAKMAKNLK